jgi:hypothetical protein
MRLPLTLMRKRPNFDRVGSSRAGSLGVPGPGRELPGMPGSSLARPEGRSVWELQGRPGTRTESGSSRAGPWIVCNYANV